MQPDLDDLYAKIEGFPEALQESNLPMLSKASVLAQIASAQALTRIADALEDIQEHVLFGNRGGAPPSDPAGRPCVRSERVED